ncbi:hypothetical protein FRB99_002752 [Tulasnella sp. 403]|nr:hypothetical protein FRB99_002752 [Tulasnella sp. 403]
MADFYEVLGVPKSATKDEVKKAYRKAALRTHPDRAPPDQKKKQEDAFRAVNAAYEILSDDANRALYDKHGVWPPPPPPQPRTQYKPRSTQRAPEFRPFANSQPFYDSDSGAHPHHQFVFTDPFTLFNMIFADLMQSHAVPFLPRHTRPPNQLFPDPFAPQFVAFPSFAQAATTFTTSGPQGTTTTTTTTHVEPVPTGEHRGWIKESKVTKITPQGTRESTIKKTAPDGTVYITRISGDGVERHSIVINGVEKPSATGAPAVPPRIPLSQTQAQVPPQTNQPGALPQAQPQPTTQPQVSVSKRSSSKHAPSASQPVNVTAQHPYQPYVAATQPPLTKLNPESQSRSHRRSASRDPTYAAGYRAASPPPASKESRPYPYAYAQAPRPRPTSPQPKEPQPSQNDLRRNHTMPQIFPSQAPAAAAPMPRPQSPHFYRSRSTSEHRRPQPVPKVASLRGVEPTMYVFSDDETARTRSTAHVRPSRSAHTYPIPNGDAYGQPTQPHPHRSHRHHAQSMQAQQPPPVPVTNELGLGFVPPPSSGLSSQRSSMSSTGNIQPNQPLGHQSRNGSYEEIVFAPSQQRPRPGAMPYGYPAAPPKIDPYMHRYRQTAV